MHFSRNYHILVKQYVSFINSAVVYIFLLVKAGNDEPLEVRVESSRKCIVGRT